MDEERRRELGFRHPEAVVLSALTGEGMDELRDRIGAAFEATLRPWTCSCPTPTAPCSPSCTTWPATSRREDTAEGVRVQVLLPATVAARYERFAVNGQA